MTSLFIFSKSSDLGLFSDFKNTLFFIYGQLNTAFYRDTALLYCNDVESRADRKNTSFLLYVSRDNMQNTLQS